LQDLPVVQRFAIFCNNMGVVLKNLKHRFIVLPGSIASPAQLHQEKSKWVHPGFIQAGNDSFDRL